MNDTLTIIENELTYWTKNMPELKKYFESNVIKSCIQLCLGVVMTHPNKKVLVSDFIAGLALLPVASSSKNKQQSHEVNELIKPVFDLLDKKGYEFDFQKLQFETNITGDSIIQENGVTTPITPKALLQHARRINAKVLTANDVDAIEQSFISFRKKQASGAEQKETAKTIKSFPQYFVLAYSKTLPDALKTEFATEKNKWIRLMLIALEQEGILTIGNRAEMHRAITKYFGRNIGSYEGVFTVFKFDKKAHAKDLECIELRIKRILLNINNKS